MWGVGLSPARPQLSPYSSGCNRSALSVYTQTWEVSGHAWVLLARSDTLHGLNFCSPLSSVSVVQTLKSRSDLTPDTNVHGGVNPLHIFTLWPK